MERKFFNFLGISFGEKFEMAFGWLDLLSDSLLDAFFDLRWDSVWRRPSLLSNSGCLTC